MRPHRDRVTLVQARAGRPDTSSSGRRPGRAARRRRGAAGSRKSRIPTRVTEPHEEQRHGEDAPWGERVGGRGRRASRPRPPAWPPRTGRACRPGGHGVARVAGGDAVTRPRCPSALAAVPLGRLLLDREPVQRPLPERVGTVRHASQRCRRPRSSRAGCRPAGGRRAPRASSGRAGGWTCPGPEPRRTGSTCGPGAAAPGCRSAPPPPR